MRKRVAARFPLHKIKQIIQSDEDIGRVDSSVYVVVSAALELFLNDLVKKSAAIAENQGEITLTPKHVKECVMKEELFDFLTESVEDVQETEQKKPAKRIRSSKSDVDDEKQQKQRKLENVDNDTQT